jgi:hypothetical protein
MIHGHHGTELAALLHRGEHVVQARRQLSDVIATWWRRVSRPVTFETTSHPMSSRATVFTL